jgi:hypothetical protein
MRKFVMKFDPSMIPKKPRPSAPWGSPRQGQSVFHNAQELEEFAGGIAKIAESDGDFIAAGET